MKKIKKGGGGEIRRKKKERYMRNAYKLFPKNTKHKERKSIK